MILNNKYGIMFHAQNLGFPQVFDVISDLRESQDILAYTDGEYIYVHKDEFNARSVEDQFFILAHEMLHIFYQHHTAFASSAYKNKELLNVCQDVVINETLRKKFRYEPSDCLTLDNFSQYLIDNGVIRDKIEYSGKLTTSALYTFIERKLRHRADPLPLPPMDIKVTENKPIDSKVLNSKTMLDLAKKCKLTTQDLQCELPSSLMGAALDLEFYSNLDLAVGGDASSSKSALKAKLKREGFDILKSRELIKYIEKFIGNYAVVPGRSQSYVRPNRRYQANDYVAKGFKHMKYIRKVTVYLDISSSMDTKLISELFSTLQNLYKTTKFQLFLFNTNIVEQDLKQNLIDIGGGTNITKVLRHIKENKFDVSILITDCEDKFYREFQLINSSVLVFTNNYNFRSTNPKASVKYFE